MTTKLKNSKNKAVKPAPVKMTKAEIDFWQKELSKLASEEINKKVQAKLEEQFPTADYMTCNTPNCRYCEFEDAVNNDTRSRNVSQNTSNVTFVAGANTEETNVFVDDTMVRGVVKANLEYDPEFPLPVLKLTILGPNVSPVLH